MLRISKTFTSSTRIRIKDMTWTRFMVRLINGLKRCRVMEPETRFWRISTARCLSSHQPICWLMKINKTSWTSSWTVCSPISWSKNNTWILWPTYWWRRSIGISLSVCLRKTINITNWTSGSLSWSQICRCSCRAPCSVMCTSSSGSSLRIVTSPVKRISISSCRSSYSRGYSYSKANRENCSTTSAT